MNLVTTMIIVSILIPVIIARPVVILLQGAVESLWFAKTYDMSKALWRRLTIYAGLWILGGIAVWLIAAAVFGSLGPAGRLWTIAGVAVASALVVILRRLDRFQRIWMMSAIAIGVAMGLIIFVPLGSLNPT